MNEDLRGRLEQMSTQQLSFILRLHDLREWRPEVFTVVESILESRGVAVAGLMGSLPSSFRFAVRGKGIHLLMVELGGWADGLEMPCPPGDYSVALHFSMDDLESVLLEGPATTGERFGDESHFWDGASCLVCLLDNIANVSELTISQVLDLLTAPVELGGAVARAFTLAPSNAACLVAGPRSTIPGVSVGWTSGGNKPAVVTIGALRRRAAEPPNKGDEADER